MAQLQRSLSPPKAPTAKDENPPSSSTADEEEIVTGPKKRVGYCLNLDPATRLVPFGASIDIRDTVDYKEVMIQHQLGPNGAIMTSLNLFATKFDQVIQILEQRSFPSTPSSQKNNNPDPTIDYILVDTPGQIEAFTWSASGSIITSALASSFPTVLAFVVDTPRCASSPSTFMSNMLYACSMLYRTKLPILIVFNKTDVVPCSFCVDWMTDFESFQEALDEHSSANIGSGSSSESGFYGSLTRSLSLMLDEFYRDLNHVGVSSATGDGVVTGEFWEAVKKSAKEFEAGYVEELKNRMEELEVKKKVKMRHGLSKFKRDLSSK